MSHYGFLLPGLEVHGDDSNLYGMGFSNALPLFFPASCFNDGDVTTALEQVMVAKTKIDGWMRKDYSTFMNSKTFFFPSLCEQLNAGCMKSPEVVACSYNLLQPTP